MTFELPKLPYDFSALEPVISQKTIEFHYGKHHQAYVDNLNKLIQGTPFENNTLEDIIKKSEGGIFNNAAQVWNHTFYFFQFAPNRKGEPSKPLIEAIEKQWKNFDDFKKEFNNAGVTLFGSGWVWLVKNKENKLEIVKTSNAENPLTKNMTPILTFDVWEHAYYLDYQNRRADHLNSLWNILNWDEINKRF